MNPPAPAPDPAELAWRLTALETQFAEHRRHMDERFDRLDANIGNLAFVRRDVYESERDRLRADIKAINGAVKLTLGTVIAAFLTALTAGLIRLAVG